MTVVLQDYSPRGVRFECPRSMEQDENFLLHMPAANGEPPRNVLCRTVHVTKRDQRAFVVGAEFICLASDAPKDDGSKLSKARISAIRDAILD